MNQKRELSYMWILTYLSYIFDVSCLIYLLRLKTISNFISSWIVQLFYHFMPIQIYTDNSRFSIHGYKRIQRSSTIFVFFVRIAHTSNYCFWNFPATHYSLGIVQWWNFMLLILRTIINALKHSKWENLIHIWFDLKPK